jgi:hypothetical protein
MQQHLRHQWRQERHLHALHRICAAQVPLHACAGQAFAGADQHCWAAGQIACRLAVLQRCIDPADWQAAPAYLRTHAPCCLAGRGHVQVPETMHGRCQRLAGHSLVCQGAARLQAAAAGLSPTRRPRSQQASCAAEPRRAPPAPQSGARAAQPAQLCARLCSAAPGMLLQHPLAPVLRHRWHASRLARCPQRLPAVPRVRQHLHHASLVQASAVTWVGCSPQNAAVRMTKVPPHCVQHCRTTAAPAVACRRTAQLLTWAVQQAAACHIGRWKLCCSCVVLRAQAQPAARAAPACLQPRWLAPARQSGAPVAAHQAAAALAARRGQTLRRCEAARAPAAQQARAPHPTGDPWRLAVPPVPRARTRWSLRHELARLQLRHLRHAVLHRILQSQRHQRAAHCCGPPRRRAQPAGAAGPAEQKPAARLTGAAVT